MTNILIYTKEYCGPCQRAKQLLQRKGAIFTEIDVTNSEKLQQEMVRKTKRMTVPQIFINVKHIGGCDDLYALEEAGKLDLLLKNKK